MDQCQMANTANGKIIGSHEFPPTKSYSFKAFTQKEKILKEMHLSALWYLYTPRFQDI